MKKWLLVQCLLAWSLFIGAQTRISGQTVDAKGEVLPGIIVKALAADGQRMLGYDVSDGEGRYNISLAAGQEPAKIVLAGMGYRTVERGGGKGNIDMGRITMEEAELELKEVTVKAPPVRTTGDTITYYVDQLKDKSDRSIEDVIKKIPGVEVDQEGRIKYQGEAINKFYIEGLDMLGGALSGLFLSGANAALNLGLDTQTDGTPVDVWEALEPETKKELDIEAALFPELQEKLDGAGKPRRIQKLPPRTGRRMMK